MKDKKAVKTRIMTEEDFIYCPRLGNSLERLLEKNPDGVDDDRIEKVLLIPKKEINKHYEQIILKLKNLLKR